MKLFHKNLYIFIQALIIFQVSSKITTLRRGEITYEYDDKQQLGNGFYADVFKGKRIEGENIDIVAFKVARQDYNSYLSIENGIYAKIGDHESIPKLYDYFSGTEEKSAVLVTQLLGDNLQDIFLKVKTFSIATIMKIGIQVLNALEYIHSKKIIHFDIKADNLAIGLENNSRIYIYDFNTSDEYEEYGDVFRLKKLYAPPFAIKSPRQDIKDLASTLIWFLGGSTKSRHIIRNILITEMNITSIELDIIFGSKEGRETLTEFLLMANDPDNDHLNYDAFRNILQTELDKHINERSYNSFEWQ